jgi:hypothetical protein
MIMPRKERRSCKNCGKECTFPPSYYCSSRCQKEYEYKQRVRAWKSKEVSGHTGKTYQTRNFVRRYLFEKYDDKCCKCGWSEKNPFTGLIPLEVNHIDGDASYSWEENLELICPNCHSLTPNFRGLNQQSVRNRK